MPCQQQRGIRVERLRQQLLPFELAVDLDHRVADAEHFVDVLVGQQFVDADARSRNQLLLGHIFRTVGIEVHACLQQVEAREIADADPRFGDAQPLARKRHGIAEILQAQRLLDVIVVFGRQAGYEVLDRDAGADSAHLLHLFELFVVGADAESVENRPVEVDPGVERLVVDAVVRPCVPFARCGALVVQRPRITRLEVDRRHHAGICRRGIVVADALLIAHDAYVVVVFQPYFQALAEGQLLLCRRRCENPRGQGR